MAAISTRCGSSWPATEEPRPVRGSSRSGLGPARWISITCDVTWVMQISRNGQGPSDRSTTSRRRCRHGSRCSRRLFPEARPASPGSRPGCWGAVAGGRRRITGLAEREGCARPAITRLVDRLQARGLGGPRAAAGRLHGGPGAGSPRWVQEEADRLRQGSTGSCCTGEMAELANGEPCAVLTRGGGDPGRS